MKFTMPKTALQIVRETESFGWYIALYKKCFEVPSVAELFYFLWYALLIFKESVEGTKASSDKITDKENKNYYAYECFKIVRETEGFGWYISLYEKSIEVASIAELFYFVWSTLLTF